MAGSAGTPVVSVVIETVTCRTAGSSARPLADQLSATLDGLARQTYPEKLIETIVVLDREVPESEADQLRQRFGRVRLAWSRDVNYCAAKNAGARAARGSVVAFIDGDCVPETQWLQRLVAVLDTDVAAVAGRTRYADGTRLGRTFSVSDFGCVVGDERRHASGFSISNVAFQRDVLLAHPLDERIRRHGGCYLLFHQLRARGKTILYDDQARVAHGADDIRGWSFLGKHFWRGFDGVAAYRLDEQRVMRGTAVFRRYGLPGLVAITAHRILLDWRQLVRDRWQIGVRSWALPYVGIVGAGLRLVELVGMSAAVIAAERPVAHRGRAVTNA